MAALASDWPIPAAALTKEAIDNAERTARSLTAAPFNRIGRELPSSGWSTTGGTAGAP